MTTKATVDVAGIVEPMIEVHRSGINQTYEWRKEQLKRMKDMIASNQKAMQEALSADLGRCDEESCLAEIFQILPQIDLFLANLRRWMKPKKMPSSFLLFPGFSQCQYKPLRKPAVCIIGAFNYAFLTCLQPAIGALAAGNPIVIKPSELCPASAQLMHDLVAKYFPPDVARVVTGGVPETQALLAQPWGKIVFTGSERVGRLVAAAAAKTLTPVLLELGGKCPTYVDENIPSHMLDNVADRIVFTKLFNCGQTCVAPDTLIVHAKHVKDLSRSIVRAVQEQFSKDPSQSTMSRIVSKAHTQRLIDYLKEVESLQSEHPDTEVIFGGAATCNLEDKYVCPTFVLNPPSECRLLKEEIFGPILPIVVVPSRTAAIDFIQNKLRGTPLALYIFTSTSKVFDIMTTACPSAAAVRNDAMIHLSNPHLPLGGLDTSGMGQYQGLASFESFSHTFPTVYRPLGTWLADLNNVRCQPYSAWKVVILQLAASIPDIPVMPWNAFAAIGVLGFATASSSGVAVWARNAAADGLDLMSAYLRS